MNTRKLVMKLAGVSIVALAASAGTLIACSGDNSNGGNPATTGGDSGSGGDVTMGGDTATGDDSSMGSDTSTSGDSGGGMDVVQIDTGGCVSDASTCNTCYSASQAATDPYNACSPYTVNCVPFSNSTRITGLSSDGGVPLVP